MNMVGRCSARAEACLRRHVDLVEIRILVIVRTEKCENHFHRKGKGSLALSISQGLASPKSFPNWKTWRKGNRLIFRCYESMCGNASVISDASG